MDVLQAIKERRSIRSFKQDPVPQKVLQEILEISCRAPSAMNSQPWEFTVLSGEMLEKVKQANVEKLRSGESPHPEHAVGNWPSDSVFRKRQVDLAKQLFQIMGIERDDKEKRTQWMERGFRYFDAPAAIIICVDSVLDEAAPLLDIGAVMQNITLAALAYDLGTCIEDQGVMYPEILRELVNIPESKRIIIAIAIGYPDWEFPANKIETPRLSLDANTSWYGF